MQLVLKIRRLVQFMKLICCHQKMITKTMSLSFFIPTVFLIGSTPQIMWACIAGIPLFLVVFSVIDYLRSKDHTFSHKLALKQYMFFRFVYFYGWYLTWKLRKNAADIKSTQETALFDILKLNCSSEYSRKWRLDQVKSREEFRQVHPISKYQQFKSYIDRTAQGEHNVIVTGTPLYFNTTSGTTGNPNLIPLVAAQYKHLVKCYALIVYNASTFVPGVTQLKRSMKIYYNPQRCLDRTPNGILVGPASANAKIFKLGENFTSPPAAFDIENESLCRYIHVLFGLRFRELTKIETVFVPVVYQAMEEMEKEWKNLVQDIRFGTLKADLNIPYQTRKLLEERLYPDQERANELEQEFKKGFHKIAKRIWPNLSLISCINGGPFINYTNLLREKYTGDILIYDPVYGASEGLIGLNLYPTRKQSQYLLVPWMTFFEFIDVENMSEDQPETLFMDQLEIGKEYEVVLTTAAGLTRYRFGDVVKVVEFYNQLPIVEFQYRSGHLMNIRGEKMSELTFIECLNATAAEMENVGHMVDYAMCTSISLPDEVQVLDEAPYYVLFVELTTIGVIDFRKLEDQLSKSIDAKVMEIHSKYRFYREKNGLGRLQVHLIKEAGFLRLRGFMLDNSKTSPSQIKVPHVLIKAPLVNFIFSQKMINNTTQIP